MLIKAVCEARTNERLFEAIYRAKLDKITFNNYSGYPTKTLTRLTEKLLFNIFEAF